MKLEINTSEAVSSVTVLPTTQVAFHYAFQLLEQSANTSKPAEVSVLAESGIYFNSLPIFHVIPCAGSQKEKGVLEKRGKY
jgi:hypothetical protein